MWDFFDKWYIITIKESNTLFIQKNLEEVGIFNYEIIEYIPAKKKINVNKNCTLLELICHTSWDETSQNIYNNHLKTIKKSIDKKFKNVVILEDDAIFNLNLDKNIIYDVVEWLKNNEWDIFFFGSCPWPLPISLVKTKNIIQPLNILLAHCYVLNNKSIKNVYEYAKNISNTHIDKIFSDSPFKKYSIYPSISYQNKPPAIFNEIMGRLQLKCSFNTVCCFLESISICYPFNLLFLLLKITFIINNKIFKAL